MMVPEVGMRMLMTQWSCNVLVSQSSGYCSCTRDNIGQTRDLEPGHVCSRALVQYTCTLFTSSTC